MGFGAACLQAEAMGVAERTHGAWDGGSLGRKRKGKSTTMATNTNQVGLELWRLRMDGNLSGMC